MRPRKTQGWWAKHINDLESLSGEEFAKKHEVPTSAVYFWRRKLIGRRERERGWYLDPAVVEALASDLPASAVATFLGGIPEGSVGRLRTQLRKRGILPPADPEDVRARMSESKRGIPANTRTRAALLKAARAKKSPSHRARIAEGNRKRHEGQPPGPVNPEHRLWTAEEESWLGTASDGDVAILVGRTVAAVRSRRQQLSVPPFRPGYKLPVPVTAQANFLTNLVLKHYESVPHAARVCKLDPKRLWAACSGKRRSLSEAALSRLLNQLKIPLEQR